MGDHRAPDRPLDLGAIGSRRKAIVGLIFTLVASAATILSPEPTPVEWCQVLAQACLLVPLYVADNRASRYAKSICAAVGAALAVLIPALLEGGTLSGVQEGVYVNAALAAAGAVGVYIVPNITRTGENVLSM